MSDDGRQWTEDAWMTPISHHQSGSGGLAPGFFILGKAYKYYNKVKRKRAQTCETADAKVQNDFI